MAVLHKFSVKEALNVDVGGLWTVNGAGTAESNADVTDTVHLDVSGTSQIGIYAGVEIYFSFAASGTDITTANDLILPKDTLTFIIIPRGLGTTVYFNYLSTTTTTGAVRVVEV